MSPVLLKAAPRGAALSAVWRADQLGAALQRIWPSGFAMLDAELPGGGWPGHGLTELLSPCGSGFEWRLLGPLLARLVAEGRDTLLVGPPHVPHMPGLQAQGLSARHLVWVRADTVAERLWCTEQLIKANPGGAVLAWLPQARPAQLRRLQVHAAACETPVFICRPWRAASESSAAPLRLGVEVSADAPWVLSLDLLKRKGPPLGRRLHLPAVPAALVPVLPPRLAQAERSSSSEHAHVVRPVSESAWH